MTGLTITEKLYNATLNPTHAEAQLTLRVLTPAELQAADEPTTTCSAAWRRRLHLHAYPAPGAWPLANLANAAESIIGMIPH